MSDQPTTFLVGIPHEALVAIREDYPLVGDFLFNIALILCPAPIIDPPKALIRRRYDVWMQNRGVLPEGWADGL